MSDRLVAQDDNPEWTDEDFAQALRGDAIPAHIRAAFPQKGASTVALEIDADVLARFKADGEGWQARINDALRRAVGL